MIQINDNAFYDIVRTLLIVKIESIKKLIGNGTVFPELAQIFENFKKELSAHEALLNNLDEQWRENIRRKERERLEPSHEKQQEKERVQWTNLESMRSAEIAKVFSVSSASVDLWHSRDGCPQNADGTFNVYGVLDWRHTNHNKMRSYPLILDIYLGALQKILGVASQYPSSSCMDDVAKISRNAIDAGAGAANDDQWGRYV